MKRRFRFLFILIPVVFIAAASLVTMGLWNWIMPALFGLGAITYFKAAGILLLAKILFGWPGSGKFSSHGHNHFRRLAFAGNINHQHSVGHNPWKTKMQERWQSLSPEQKEKFSAPCGKRFNRHMEQENTNNQDTQAS